MCIVCAQWEAGKLTSKEALRNLGEMIGSSDDEEKTGHYFEACDKIIDKEVPFLPEDEELNKKWQDKMDK
jgi:hypothetical protein